jgi:hypothetical protein
VFEQQEGLDLLCQEHTIQIPVFHWKMLLHSRLLVSCQFLQKYEDFQEFHRIENLFCRKLFADSIAKLKVGGSIATTVKQYFILPSV